ncbi:aromatic prenyltransferase [Colletotrichum incanum]|uniref:Aromatic prenyltransferase n=1 Tax=Colletotrichum incanum TaxID=1573173 RepID=A0A167DMG1_COLIC|nr:aromatic prenyltransferase [Colletotrichum incanum]OHW95303.1 aromatic prenyltransferase [Colletotrichum incanum]
MVAAILSLDFDISQEATTFWEQAILPPLVSLMQSAGYSITDQEHYVGFINQFVVPSLGPRPKNAKTPTGTKIPHFDSFCNDDFTPAEISWNIAANKSTIRVGFEPIGIFAGTAKDPFNQIEPGVAISRLLRQHDRNSSTEVQLWELLKTHFHVASNNEVASRMAPGDHKTSNTISFDLQGKWPSPKLYFYATPISLLTDTSTDDIITTAVTQLPLNLEPSFRYVRLFLENEQHNHNSPRLELLSVDAVCPTDARIKLYMRTKDTSFDRVKEIYTLKGALNGPEIDAGLNLIRLFYLHVLGISAPGDNLPCCKHLTAGIGFNMEIMHNRPVPIPKVYIPIRHYGGTDLRIAQSLSNFFRACGLQQAADNYLDALRNAFQNQDFSDTIGRQTYAALSYNNNGPYVTIYYNLMTFSTGKERDEEGRLVGPAVRKPHHYFYSQL